MGGNGSQETCKQQLRDLPRPYTERRDGGLDTKTELRNIRKLLAPLAPLVAATSRKNSYILTLAAQAPLQWGPQLQAAQAPAVDPGLPQAEVVVAAGAARTLRQHQR